MRAHALCLVALLGACAEGELNAVGRFDPDSVDAIAEMAEFSDWGDPCSGEVQERTWPTARQNLVKLEIDRKVDAETRKASMILAFDRSLFFEAPVTEDIPVVEDGEPPVILDVDVYIDNHDGTISHLDGRFFPNMTPVHAHGALEVRGSGCPRTYAIHGDLHPPPSPPPL